MMKLLTRFLNICFGQWMLLIIYLSINKDRSMTGQVEAAVKK